MNRLAAAQCSAIALAALAGTAIPVAVPTAVAQDAASPRQQPNQNRITLPSGRIGYATPNNLLNQRTIAIPGTTTLLVLWDEIGENGAQTPHYLVSRDGRTVAGRPRDTSYEVALKYGTFDPRAGLGLPQVEQLLQAPAESRLYLVQCHVTALPEFQEQIAALGGEIVRHIPHHTMIVRMDGAAAAQVAQLPFVRWTDRYHTAYKLDAALLATVRESLQERAETHYSLEVFERGMNQQQAVAARVRALGGTVENFTADQFRMEASLTPAALIEIARMDEVHFMEPWQGPGGHDMNIVRSISGADFLTAGTLAFDGQGVRGEVFDTEVRTAHENFTFATTLHGGSAGNAANPHGTSVMSIVFGDGNPSANALGLLPAAESRIFYNYINSSQFTAGQPTRLTLNQQLVDPAGAFRAVFQTSSVGNTQTTQYTTISAEVDDYLYLTQLLSCQSQSNTSNQNSRPQAWAKNIVSVGAYYHINTAGRADDTWPQPVGGSCGATGAASIGPSADARIKPDLSFFYDCTFAATNAGNNIYDDFGGTSGATPSVAGCFGLFFQMWHESVWKGRGGASDVFTSRAKMTTAKAALINTAFKYNWLAGGPNASINRNVQGWGMPDLQNLYNERDSTFIVDEEDALPPLGVKNYYVRVQPGEPVLNVTMSYVDRMGTAAAAIHRVNDLSLRVISPTGTSYWGNNGLTAGNTSTSGGVSNTRDTVENVFVASPAAGVWRIQVFGDDIVQDTHPETAAVDADYSIWATGATEVRDQGPWGYTVQSNGNQHLYRVNLSTGDATDLGLLTFNDSEGVCVGPNGDLFAIGGSNNQLWNISLPPGTLVGPTPPRPPNTDAGLEFFNGTMYNLQGASGNSALYRVNPATASAALVGTSTIFADNLAINGLGQGFAIDGIFTDSLYSVNLGNGALTSIGGLGLGNISVQFGSSFSENQTLYAIDSAGGIYTLNTSTGAATRIAKVDINGVDSAGFEGLAIDRTSACRFQDLPAFASTFTGNTRGYFFTSPVNAQICGLRVPNEFGDTVQNIEVVRFNTAPPLFSATTNNFVSLGRYVNMPADDIVHVDIPISAGDIIGVLGTTGTATAHNSYAGASANTFSTSIKGVTVGTKRLGMQFNLNTTPARDLWTENVSPISRVELYYLDGSNEVYIDGDTLATGSSLTTQPLVNQIGTTTFVGEFVTFTSDPELVAAGALGNILDVSAANPTASLRFNFDVESVTCIYGGNIGGITIEARNAANAVVDTFTQADTNTAPAGPVTLAAPGIRSIQWIDTTGGAFAGIDNIRIRATSGCYANCDNSTTPPILNVADFGCFLTKYAAGDSYANCDGSTTAPVLNVADFGCFLTRYAAGCN
ncbi:MAG: S8 family serine peptidase [Phycisphaerales bacterium]